MTYLPFNLDCLTFPSISPDQAISSIESRFENFQIYENIFGFLFNFEKLKSLDDDSLKKKCLNLKCFLTHETYSDIDGLDLFSKLKVLKEVLQINENFPINVLNYIKRLASFLNTCIAFRILLTIPVTVASTKRSFSKLKLIKSYLRTTMLHERLGGLAMLSIKNEILVELECKNLISNFASQKARKINFN